MAPIRQLIQQGTAAFQAGDYAVAEPILREVVHRAPRYANVFHMLGVIVSQEGLPAEAIRLFREALRVNPGYREARLNLAIALTETGAYAEAAAEAGKLALPRADAERLSLGVRGRLANAHADLARQYQAVGWYDKAVREYDEALELCPDFPDIHHCRALSCREAGDLAGAEASLRRALELNPGYVDAHVSLGWLLRKRGRLADAARAWEQALALDPEHRLARLSLAQARSEMAGGERPAR